MLIVIPAFNEERNLHRVLGPLSCLHVPVLVVDDGSSDRTSWVAAHHGALVMIVPENAGKAEAVKQGLRFPVSKIVLLDADLLGFTCEHARLLLKWTREIDVARLLLKGGRLSTTWAHLISPALAGQRIIPKALLEEFFNSEKVEGFQLEVALEDFLKMKNVPVKELVLEGVGQVMKEEKRGLVRGFLARLKMYTDIISYKVKKGP